MAGRVTDEDLVIDETILSLNQSRMRLRGTLGRTAERVSVFQLTGTMDFADATLVLLADELAVTEIVTLDRRGFSTYRTPKGKGFRLVLKT